MSSRMRTKSDKGGQFKSHSASPTSSKGTKINLEENRVKSSPSKRVPGTLDVQDILSRCQEIDQRRVFEIDLNRQGLSSVPDLHEFVKLRIIDLGCNKIKKVSPKDFEKNTDLRELKLYVNELTEITGLECCKELSNLLLQHNKIKSIGKSLQNVRKLRVLRLDNNRLSSVEPREIGCCSQLAILDISSNNIMDISALNALPALEELDVSNNRIQRVIDLGRCKKIQELDISRNQLTDLSGLKGLSCLTVLRADHNKITSLDSIGKLRQLQELYISNNKLFEAKGFVGQFPSLEILDISNNAITSLDEMFSLSEILTLVELTANGNPFDPENSFSCHRQISESIPQLELLNKVSLKRPSTSHSHGPPAMRPLSASQVLSSRQVEEQIKAADMELTSFEASISSRFSIVQDLFKSLPEESTVKTKLSEQSSEAMEMNTHLDSSRPATAGEGRPASRCSSRSRIAEARAFAAEHFHPKKK